MNSIYELDNVTFRYPESIALSELSLSVSTGDRIAILGANGSGKSTLLRILAGLVFPQSGSVKFLDKPVTEEGLAEDGTDFRRRVGIVFQNPDVQLFNPTVFDEVAFGPMQLNWPKDKVIERVNAVLGDLDIMHLKDRTPHRLSGGEKKRVALASVLVLDPDVLLMDEPTAALDPKSQGQMIDFLFGCAGKKTVITATHNLEIIEDIADRCIVLDKGRLAASGAASEILPDEGLLQRTHLLYTYRHRHPSGVVHSHPHIYPHHRHTESAGNEGEG